MGYSTSIEGEMEDKEVRAGLEEHAPHSQLQPF